jgi:hypothetical protein
MLATIIDPRTGKTHTIFPERWGLPEEALTWLEQGECLLTSGLVYPRLGSWFNDDPTVSIFMSEQDLQRLMAKQEVKQQSVPDHDTLPPKLVSDAEAERIFDTWRKDRGDNIPSAKEDIAHMKQHGVNRSRVRKLRQRPGVKKRPSGKSTSG